MVSNIGESGEFEQLGIPLFSDAVPAGFPSPATDYCERKLDLNELCIGTSFIVQLCHCLNKLHPDS